MYQHAEMVISKILTPNNN